MAAVAPKETDQAAAAAASDNDNNAQPPAKLLHPQLLMAARRGDSKRLKELLGLEKDDENDDESGMLQVPKAAAKQDEGAVVVEVDRHWPSSAAAVARDDSPPLPLLGLDGVTTGEGDSLLHVVAASGDNKEFLDCATMIHDQVSKGLLGARNNKGDTPLHCAAGAGNAHMISCLVGLLAANTADDVEATAAAKVAFLRTQNECGETALHQAIRAPENKQVACIDQLMVMDPDLAYIPHAEDATSPLYLAISLGELRIARHLLHKTKGKLSYFGPDGRNVLHAAVSGRQALHMVLKWLKREPTTTADDDMRQQESQVVAHRLLSQLTNQRDKENGSTPLHLAASLGGLPSPNINFYETHPHFWGWSGSPAILLLDANESTAYQPDKKGMYPIHVAAGSGCLRVMKALLEKCPECATLRDAKGRTFLHVAVDEGQVRVVEYVRLVEYLTRERSSTMLLRLELEIIRWRNKMSCADDQVSMLLPSILNAQDINGDTALHRAVHAGNEATFFNLVENERVRLDVTNKKGMTPIDVAWSVMPLKDYYAWDHRIHIRKYLLQVGAPYGKNRGDLFNQRYKLPKQVEDKISENLTGASQVLGLFSVLMATATFASAFTLPGGYRSAGDGGGVAGTPVLAGPRRSYAFDAFVLSNALAFLCSLYATSLLLYAGVPYGNLNQRFRTINVAYSFMWQAGRSLLAAFALGLYVVLFPVARTIAIAVLVLVIFAASGGFFKITQSEGIHSIVVIGRRGRLQPKWEKLLHWIIYASSYIIIFSLPAIHRWARLPW